MLREIFGEAGLYFNPHDEEDLAKTILRVILDKNFKDRLLQNQKNRLKIFDKEKIIDEYIELFDKIKSIR